MENASSPVMDDTTNNRSFFARGHGESLENRKFYLYFEARRPRIEAQIVEELRHLGAVVEPFFGRDISYVITDMIGRTTATRGSPVSDGILSKASSSDERRCAQPITRNLQSCTSEPKCSPETGTTPDEGSGLRKVTSPRSTTIPCDPHRACSAVPSLEVILEGRTESEDSSPASRQD